MHKLKNPNAIFYLYAEVKAQQAKDEPYVGVNIGTDVSNLLPPAKLVSFLQQQKVSHTRHCDSNSG